MNSVPTIIKNVVDAVRDNGSYSGDAPYYHFGHHTYISNILKDKAKAGQDSFPLVALILDITQNMYPSNLSLETTMSFNIVLANATNPEWTPEERELNNFKGVLYPLYEDLLNEMFKSHYFNISSNQIPHVRTDMYFYNTEEGQNKWNRYVDAIELSFSDLELIFNENC
jgi:hypothetical protein